MIEVGLEFVIDRANLSQYGKDFLIALTAATFPWLLCGIYLFVFFDINWKEAALVSLFAAPTSAGVLFTMLASAGLAMTWLFKKARILAIADDIATLLLLVPFQMAYMGMKWQSFASFGLIAILLLLSYRFLHQWKLPTGKVWFVGYAILLTIFCGFLENTMEIHLAVIIPSFALGCIVFNPHDPTIPTQHQREHKFIEPEGKVDRWIDNAIKMLFMFLVGCSLPKIGFASMGITIIIIHILALTLLSNIGKLFPYFCYKNEASQKERLALSIALFPRGEVGAGVLILAMNYGLKGTTIGIAGLSLGLNLLLTGLFISVVILLIKGSKASSI